MGNITLTMNEKKLPRSPNMRSNPGYATATTKTIIDKNVLETMRTRLNGTGSEQQIRFKYNIREFISNTEAPWSTLK
jgi:hypothetical protein